LSGILEEAKHIKEFWNRRSRSTISLHTMSTNFLLALTFWPI